MKCEEILDLIDAYVDEELSNNERKLIEDHVDSCTSCQKELRDTKDLKKNINKISRYPAPSELSDAISQRLSMEDIITPSKKSWVYQVASYAAMFVLGIFGTLLLIDNFEKKEKLVSEVFISHLHSTMSSQFGRVSSSDSHTVKPWFVGKIDYAPPVLDLTQSGFPLLSGHISYLNGKAVATLTYGRRKHNISLFIIPKGDMFGKPSPIVMKRGYSILGWERNEFIYQAVSDIHHTDLKKFAALLNTRLRQ